ncbi:hemolysin D [Bradyrhizobium sp. CCBAU 21359]|uniref:HlyD family secretion protein n=1 Tax=Bradyrhizobium sp. CCBAU 21359 TaxID=1325080 RepID=UPI0023065D0B|nr:HlyD family secretion protein [Bradyrhizobium sp. CCBAU 21359]MDA9457560.1 hemolysin D [Bradyrhizobium sp. CCBAU 21359]
MTQVENVAAVAAPLPTAWRRLAIPGVAVVAALGLIAWATISWDSWISDRASQSTNDAYVRAEMTRLSSRVAAAVKTVNVVDYQHVKAGDILIQIDPADYEAQVAQTEANVVSAKATLDNLTNQIELQYATIAQAEAQRSSAAALETEARQEQQRQQTLSETQSGTRQKLEQAVAAYAKAQADVKAASAMIAAQRHQIEVLNGQKEQRKGELLAAQASLQAAKLRLGYTTVVAPFDGIVGERQVQPGDYVNIGSSLINVVPIPNVYVIANFKETQLTRMRPDQPVEIVVDTFSREKLRGRIERVAPASGSQFALLPPDNATGNFTKVVQRVPVRIKFDPEQPLVSKLLPGMSVTTTVDVSDARGPDGGR